VSSARIVYRPREDASADRSASALANVYRFVLSKSNASQKAVKPAPKLDGHDDAKEAWFPHGGGVLMGGGTSVGAVVPIRRR
jgi:hypothetical protein